MDTQELFKEFVELYYKYPVKLESFQRELEKGYTYRVRKEPITDEQIKAKYKLDKMLYGLVQQPKVSRLLQKFFFN